MLELHGREVDSIPSTYHREPSNDTRKQSILVRVEEMMKAENQSGKTQTIDRKEEIFTR